MLTVILEAAFRSLLMATAVWAAIRVLRMRAVLAQKVAWVLVLAAAGTMPLVMRLPGLTLGRALQIPIRSFQGRSTQTVAASTVSITSGSPSLEVVRDSAMVAKPAPARWQAGTSARKARPFRERLARASEILPALGAPVALTVTAQETVLPAIRDGGEAGLSWRGRLASWMTWAHVRLVLAALYLAVVSVLLLRALAGVVIAFRIWRRSQPVPVAGIGEATEGARALRVRVSPELATPVTIGSTIILPESSSDWDEAKLRIVLAHEQSHVRQGDFYLQLVAAIYAAIFWFSPLGWWLKRKLSELGEALSDKAGLEQAPNASTYAQVLLEFAAMPRTTPLAGVAMARSSNLSSRIERILNARSFRLSFSTGRGHAVLAATLVPAALLAAIACVRIVPAVEAQQAPAAKPAPAAKDSSAGNGQSQGAGTAAGTGSAAASGESFGQVAPDTPDQVTDVDTQDPPAAVSVPPGPQIAPVAPVAPVAPMPVTPNADVLVAPKPEGLMALTPPVPLQAPGNFAYGFSGDDDDNSFAIIQGNGHITMSGHKGKALEEAKRKYHDNFIWFERDGKSYVITDPAILAQSKEMFRSDPRLEQMKSQLDSQQAVLNKQMAEMNAKMSLDQLETPEFKARMAQLNAQLADLQGEKMRKLMDEINEKVKKATASLNEEMKNSKGLTSEQLQELQSDRLEKLSELQSERMEKLGDLQGQIGEIQGHIGELQGELGEKRGEWGEKQGELGEKMGELGEKMGRIGEEEGRKAEEASRKMRPIFDQAIKDGKARPVD